MFILITYIYIYTYTLYILLGRCPVPGVCCVLCASWGSWGSKTADQVIKAT